MYGKFKSNNRTDFEKKFNVNINESETKCIYDQLKEAQSNGKTIKEYLGVYYQIDNPEEPDVNKTEKRIITYKIQ